MLLHTVYHTARHSRSSLAQQLRRLLRKETLPCCSTRRSISAKTSILVNDTTYFRLSNHHHHQQRSPSSSSSLSCSSFCTLVGREYTLARVTPACILPNSPLTNQSIYKNDFNFTSIQIRSIQTEREYLPIATRTLQTIHDTVDALLEQQSFITTYEIEFSQGVLTMTFPPHGTWVINQQIPNLQIWWSSPLSGPKRFQYDETDQLWFSTKDGLNLGHALSQEIHHIYPDLDIIALNV